jgi:quinone-modifying oxidoreductase subunit QmoC
MTAHGTLVRPDRAFVETLLASGGGDLKRCFQCATCSVVCDLSNGRPFPRREMLWAQWGLRDRLVADPAVWLCHQCNDCSTRCPRGARPGDVLAAVRQQAIRHFAVPRFLATWVNGSATLPLVLLAPVLLMAGALLARDPLARLLGTGPEHGLYAEFFPHWLLIGFFGLFTGLAAVAAVAGVGRFWRALRAADEAEGRYVPTTGLGTSLLRVLRALATHDRFARCGAQGGRRWAHLAAFYGFLALYVVTIWAVIDLYVNPPLLGIASRYPFGLLHPMKLLANVGGLLLVYGAARAILDRRRRVDGTPASTAFDWIFAWLLLAVGATGFAVEVLRFSVAPAQEALAHGVYLVHLVVVFQLLVYLPYSKFAHLLYRTAAMVYVEHTARHLPAVAAEADARPHPVGVVPPSPAA